MTTTPTPAPLPTKAGSRVIAHTSEDSTRRPFLLDEGGAWFGPGPKGVRFWHPSEDLIDPVPAKAVEVRP